MLLFTSLHCEIFCHVFTVVFSIIQSWSCSYYLTRALHVLKLVQTIQGALSAVTSRLLFGWSHRSFHQGLFAFHNALSTPAKCKYPPLAYVLHHSIVMLSFSDRQRKFELLRAHWEASNTRESAVMVGRDLKPGPQDGGHNDFQHNVGSKIRRKLSNGLALISLTQRKGVPGRQPSSNASLAVSAPNTEDSSTAILDHDAFALPHADSALVTNSDDLPLSSQDSARTSGSFQTPQPLPRSRTFSYIPRPVKLDTEASPVTEREGTNDTSTDTIMSHSQMHLSSRIPTPSPPQSKRRVSSPRQYVPSNPSLQAKIAKNRKSFIGAVNGSPSKAAVRSRTTPNLVKTSTPESASFMAPRKQGLRRSFAPFTPQKLVLAENIPRSERIAQRQSQIQESTVKRESLVVPSAATKRLSFGAQSNRASFTTSVNVKRLSAHLEQTPVTVKRVSTRVPEGSHKPHSPCLLEDTALPVVSEPSSASSSTPTLSTIDILQLPLAPPPKIRTSADNEAQRRTLGTPNGLSGIWRSSKVFAAANHQVRRLPRSSTFHHFGKRLEAPPSVPSVPIQYRLLSQSNLIHSSKQQDSSMSMSRHHLPAATSKYGSSTRSLLSDIASTQRSKEAASIKSVSTSVSATVSEAPEDADVTSLVGQAKTLYRFQDEIESNNAQSGVTSRPSNDTTTLPSIQAVTTSNSMSHDLLSVRRWSISQRFYPNSANENKCIQVKDYMPPLHWAGRFQSRFDQWRTEAMVAQLHPDVKPEDDGALGQCNLNDERKAVILIFMQLRDLCASAQAADSLHVSWTTERLTQFDVGSQSIRSSSTNTAKITSFSTTDSIFHHHFVSLTTRLPKDPLAALYAD